MLRPTPYESLLIKELHRAEFADLAAVFGDKYEPISDDDLAKMAVKWLPLLRGYVHHELQLSLQREAALRAMVDNAGSSQ